MPKNTTPLLLVAEQVAEQLNIPVTTLRKNCSANPEAVPPFLKLGGAINAPVRWRQCDVDDWLQAQFDACNHRSDSLLTSRNPGDRYKNN